MDSRAVTIKAQQVARILNSFIRKPVTKLLSLAEEYFICLWKILFEIRFRF